MTTTKCVFGDLASHKLLVLYGDSHAQMWLPALVPVATALSMRLVLIWHTGCPVVKLPNTSALCISVRKTAIALVNSLHASLVLLANRNMFTTAVNFPQTEWLNGMEATIKALQTATTKVAVVQDVTIFNSWVPNCLAAHPTSVQKCSVLDPNPKFVSHQTAEKNAAIAEKAGYIATKQWLCAAACSPIIGNMIVDFDADHVTATYSEYLATVWQTAVTHVLS
jgi:hypothetical protein